MQLDERSWVDVGRGWLPDADALYDELVETLPWRSTRVYRYDHWVTEPRLSTWCRADSSAPPRLLEAHRQLQRQYGVTFDQFATIQVKIGAGQHPLFHWLTSRTGFEGDVSWNFNKFLIARDGTLVGRWSETIDPDLDGEIDLAIQAELAKPTPDF